MMIHHADAARGLLSLIVLLGGGEAARARSERSYARELCAGMQREVELANGARVDCVSEAHAIEVEFSESGPKRSARTAETAELVLNGVGSITVDKVEQRPRVHVNGVGTVKVGNW